VPLALLALAVGAFGIGTTEFVMMGVLPQAAGGLGVSIPTAGHLVTGYALGVVLGAPTLSALGTRLPRKTMLMLMMGLFTVGNLLFALSPDAGSGVAFRFLAGLPHGAFFGVGAVVAASLAGEGSRARAVSMMFMGLTVANVLGVPVGTLLGQQLGWRSTFFVVSGVGLLALAAIAGLVPHQGRPAGDEASLRAQLGAFRTPQVWLSLAIVTVGLGGTFACLSYVTPILTNVSGFSPTGVTGMLALVGLGMTAGNVLGGRLADRALMPGLCVALIAIATVLLVFTAASGNKVTAAVTVFLVGLGGFMVAPIMQARVMRKAGGAPSLVSAAVQSAFNIANSIGAYLGGLAIAGGFGLTSPAAVGAGLAVLGLVLAIGSGLLDQQGAAGRTVSAVEQPEPV
jgi:DHA1 family inner membrane transport protein